MYSLFDTLNTMRNRSALSEINDDEEYAYKKYILTRYDPNTMKLTNIFDFDITRNTDSNNNCLTLACRFDINLEVIKYLIEEHKMNINHIDYYGVNCLGSACRWNTNLAIIKYLIEEHKMNINHIDYSGVNCLGSACQWNTNLAIIKYLIEEHKMNIGHVDEDNTNCVELACWQNTNLAIIKYLIEEHKMNIDHRDNFRNNYLTLACLRNKNPAVIKYLIEEYKININHVDNSGRNCLVLACLENTNLAIIKYLIEEHKMNIARVDRNNDNCLTGACEGNTNLAIIKYLIEEHKMNIARVNRNNDNCLTLACQGNDNLTIIKYLIEEHKMDINHINHNNDNCLALACRKNTNIAVIKYLIEERGMKIDKIQAVKYDKFKNIVLMISKGYRDLNNLLLMGYEKYEFDEMKKIINLINPLQLNDDIRNLAGIQKPHEYKFTQFALFVNELVRPMELIFKNKRAIVCPELNLESNNNMRRRLVINKNRRLVVHKKSQKRKILFVHNKKEYYGDRNIVYGSIHVLNGLLYGYDMTDYITLEGSLPCYAIHQYIDSCYGLPFELKNIHKDDFINFMRFIDQYPSTNVSINSMEEQIIGYLEEYDANYEVYFKSICQRYDLKNLYVHMHNLKLSLKNDS
jgi:hypothetical protein